jgi:hypothetical protein
MKYNQKYQSPKEGIFSNQSMAEEDLIFANGAQTLTIMGFPK